MSEPVPIPRELEAQVDAINAEAEAQAAEAREQMRLATAAYGERLRRIEDSKQAQIRSLGATSVQDQVEGAATINRANGGGLQGRLQGFRDGMRTLALTPGVLVMSALYMGRFDRFRLPFRGRRQQSAANVAPAQPTSATGRNVPPPSAAAIPRPVTVHRTPSPAAAPTPEPHPRPHRVNSLTDAEYERLTTKQKLRRREFYLGKQEEGEGKKVLYVLGGLAVGFVGGYLAARYGFNMDVPEWARDNPEWYRDLANQNIDPAILPEAYEDPDFYNQLREAELSDETIGNIYENAQMYGQMIEQGIEESELYEFFKNIELRDAVLEAEYTSEEIAQVVPQGSVFLELTDAGMPVDVIPEILQYPELIQVIDAEGTDAQIIQAIKAHPELFEGLAEMDATYAVVEDVMLHPDEFGLLLDRIGEEELTVTDIVRDESPDVVVEPEPVTPPAEVVQPSETFYVEPEHGLTHELRDKLVAEGRPQTGEVYWNLHLHLIETNGEDYLRGIPLYDMDGGFGHVGIAYSGNAWWEPGVPEEIDKYLASLN